jgi:hypothetical protein
MAEIKHVGLHAEDLADGRMVGPGETITVDDELLGDPHNKRLLDEGVFIRLDELPKALEGPEATEEAIKLARKERVSLADVRGTGEGKRILVSDVEAYVEKQKGGNA